MELLVLSSVSFCVFVSDVDVDIFDSVEHPEIIILNNKITTHFLFISQSPFIGVGTTRMEP